MMRQLVLIISFLICHCGLYAQVQVNVKAPSQVVQGQTFRLQYDVNGMNVEGIELGATPGLENLSGPNVSRSQSITMVNGKTTQNVSTTLTYFMRAVEAGKHTIEPATVTYEGKQIKSRQVVIEVLPSDQTPQQGGGGRTPSQGRDQRTQSSDSRDAFVTVSASKTNVYEQEAVLITFKAYMLFQPTQIMDDNPEISGCHLQDMSGQGQRSVKLEHYNGRNYQTVVWRQYLAFPQQSGKLHIPAVKYEIYGQQAVRSMDPMDLFFGGGSMVQEFKKVVHSPALDINVKALPTPRPANFSGAVGQFNLSTSLTPQELKANDALTLRVVVSGTGNMKLIKAPAVTFPNDFETYDAKVDDKTRLTNQGATGNKVFDYVAVPRFGGNYDIAPVEFCYFDPVKGEYVTLTGEPYTVQVEKGSGSPSQSYTPQKEDLAVLAEDIRYIKRGNTHPVSEGGTLFGSSLYWTLYGCAIALFAVVAIVFRRQIKANADIARQRGRKAGRAAGKRLKRARSLMKERNTAAFYDEILKAVWGFMADKLNIDVAQLGRDNVADRMAVHGVGQDMIDTFVALVDDCEFARYAPGDPSETMDKIYAKAEHLIENIKL